ncbi:FG-GAP repeat domain-containing protein [Streptomyces sp. NPDC086010]|uniref:FG-GAP repeat domain-containing protein n=1 Tax=Streptomyces sp. NPDC086010 TaxID=3365745 RepID=UPI0037D15FB9
MRNTNRRGLRLASVLIASGLALTVAPAVHADDNGLLTLTESQAEKLAQHSVPDVYGDGGKSLEQATEDAGTSADSTSAGGTDAASPWKLTKKSGVEGAQGMVQTFPVGGSKGDYFTVNSLTPIQRVGADGKRLWSRDSTSLDSDWKVTPTPRAVKEPYPAAVVMGFNAVDPFSPTSDNGVTTGDLTGDGVDDIVFTAKSGVNPYRPFTSPGSSLPNGTFVTILDGATGKTLWSKLFAAAYNIKLVGRTLVVADSAYDNMNSPADSKTTLNGFRFDHADGELTPSRTWTYDAGTYPGVSWGSLEPIGDGLLAASWNQAKRYAPDKVAGGHTLVIDTKDGSVKWAKGGSLYVRQLHLDAARGRIVALEQSDYADGVKYELSTYAPGDGTRASLGERINAFPLDLEVGDIQGGSKPEYTVSESTIDESLSMNSNSVRVLNGDDARLLWSRTLKRPENQVDGDVASVWGLQAVDGRLIASAMDDKDKTTAENRYSNHYARITAFNGADGDVKWEKRGTVGSMLGGQLFRKNGDWRLRTTDIDQNVRTYRIGNGKQESVQPIEGIPYTAVATDINGDKKQDLVVGGSSDGLYAYDGPSMVSGTPKRLWTSTVPGRVVQVIKADTTGDGRDEIVVAASEAVAIVDARTGKVLTTIQAAHGEYVRNVVASNLDGDRAAEIAVTTDKVRAYEGNGSLKWEYAVPSEIGTPAFADLSANDGKVYAQYQTRGELPTGPVAVGGVALNGQNGKAAWNFTPKAPAGTTGDVLGIPLRAGTFASKDIPYADGHAVVFTYVVRGDSEQTPPNQLTNITEIRDGRTGELLHQSETGGFATIGNWFTGPEGLVQSRLVSLRTFGADQKDDEVHTLAEIRTSSFATGPDGARIVVSSGVQVLNLYPASVLTSGASYPAATVSTGMTGSREHFVADLDGDGKDEVMLLAFDDYGTDRTAGLVGNTVSGPYTAIRSLATWTIDKS